MLQISKSTLLWIKVTIRVFYFLKKSKFDGTLSYLKLIIIWIKFHVLMPAGR